MSLPGPSEGITHLRQLTHLSCGVDPLYTARLPEVSPLEAQVIDEMRIGALAIEGFFFPAWLGIQSLADAHTVILNPGSDSPRGFATTALDPTDQPEGLRAYFDH
ncbi:MAG: hypothetical protein EPN30_03260 [Actinomycetota bacterium]|nr:MAG: hypothetical protein EPN30_03260 [Actinomycetota bacterium]